MKMLAAIILSGCLLSGQSKSKAVAPNQGWASLFDGRSLAGWNPEHNAKWRVVNGILTSDSGGDGWLRSNKAYADFILKCEYRGGPNINSGVFFRASQKSTAEGADPLEAYELQIFNENSEGWRSRILSQAARM